MAAGKRDARKIDIHWDSGTAYDFFISQAVLSDPKRYGVPSSWASGMRARLRPEDRSVLDAALLVLNVPARWVHSLPEPKDAERCLEQLARIPVGKRLAALAMVPKEEAAFSALQTLLVDVMRRESWNDEDLEALREALKSKRHPWRAGPQTEDLRAILETWAHAKAFGEQYPRALRSYYDVFFKEEERRITPKLAKALARAKERSRELPSVALVEEISQGIHYDETPDMAELTLVPSYWISPFVQIHRMDEDCQLWTFGARPAEDAIVPGEPIPDALRVSLKALADPTRLKILHYLNREPLTVGDLAKRLRLRMPTVIHHLSTLRLAGLIRIHVESREKGHRTRFSVRSEGLDGALHSLRAYLERDSVSE